ncbi:unnamed protein product [Closterium sp. NIES-65]|nr:unnamed protein product [Closterium sp. NIES-65]
MPGRFVPSPALPPASPGTSYSHASPGNFPSDEPGSARNERGHLSPTDRSLPDAFRGVQRTSSDHVSSDKTNEPAEPSPPREKSRGSAEAEGGTAKKEQMAKEAEKEAQKGEDGEEEQSSGERKGPGEVQKKGAVSGKTGEGGIDGGKGGSGEGEWCEALAGEVCLVACRRPQLLARSERGRGAVCVNIDDELVCGVSCVPRGAVGRGGWVVMGGWSLVGEVYEPYCMDFGPLSLACIHRYCDTMDRALQVIGGCVAPATWVGCGVLRAVDDSWVPARGALHVVPCTWCPARGALHVVPCTWCPARGALHVVVRGVTHCVPCHVIRGLAFSCHLMPPHATPCQPMPPRATPCHPMPFCALRLCVLTCGMQEGRGLSRRVVHVCSSVPHKKANAALLVSSPSLRSLSAPHRTAPSFSAPHRTAPSSSAPHCSLLLCTALLPPSLLRTAPSFSAPHCSPWVPLLCCDAHATAVAPLAAYLILRHAMPANAAHAVLRPLEPLPPFRDASNGVCTFHISALDCCQALERAQERALIAGFRVGEYERLEQADLTWMLPGRLLAFSTPADDPASVMVDAFPTPMLAVAAPLHIPSMPLTCRYLALPLLPFPHSMVPPASAYPGQEGYLTPEDYVQYFRQAGIAAIIRLNRRVYDKRRFTRHGFAFYDLYFPDGGSVKAGGQAPSDGIVRLFAMVEGSKAAQALQVERFFAVVEGSNGPVAIHCKVLSPPSPLRFASLPSALTLLGYIATTPPSATRGAGANGGAGGVLPHEALRHDGQRGEGQWGGEDGGICGQVSLADGEDWWGKAIAYTRLVRPGSVIGQQQHFLALMHPRMARAHGASSDITSGHLHVQCAPLTLVIAMPTPTGASVPVTSRATPLALPSRTGRKVYARTDEQAAAAVADLQFARHSRSLARTGSVPVRPGSAGPVRSGSSVSVSLRLPLGRSVSRPGSSSGGAESSMSGGGGGGGEDIGPKRRRQREGGGRERRAASAATTPRARGGGDGVEGVEEGGGSGEEGEEGGEGGEEAGGVGVRESGAWVRLRRLGGSMRMPFDSFALSLSSSPALRRPISKSASMSPYTPMPPIIPMTPHAPMLVSHASSALHPGMASPEPRHVRAARRLRLRGVWGAADAMRIGGNVGKEAGEGGGDAGEVRVAEGGCGAGDGEGGVRCGDGECSAVEDGAAVREAECVGEEGAGAADGMGGGRVGESAGVSASVGASESVGVSVQAEEDPSVLAFASRLDSAAQAAPIETVASGHEGLVAAAAVAIEKGGPEAAAMAPDSERAQTSASAAAAAAAAEGMGVGRKTHSRAASWLGLSFCGLLPCQPTRPPPSPSSSLSLSPPTSPGPSLPPTSLAAAGPTGTRTAAVNPHGSPLPVTAAPLQACPPCSAAGAAERRGDAEGAAEEPVVEAVGSAGASAGLSLGDREEHSGTATDQYTPADAAPTPGVAGTHEYTPADADLAPRFGRTQAAGVQGAGGQQAGGPSSTVVRVINAGGQPRKVVVPAGQEGRGRGVNVESGLRGVGGHAQAVSVAKFGAVQGGRFRLGVRR